MTRPDACRRQLVIFVGVVFLVSVPFWVAGAISGATVTGSLSVGSLMVVAPFVAAMTVSAWSGGGSAIRRLLARAVDPRLPRGAHWYLAAFGLMPMALVIEVAALRLAGHAVPPFRIVPPAVVTDLGLFWVAATLEEIGWSGFATDRLQARLSPLSSGLVLGGVWAIWHVIAMLEMPAGHDIGWIVLQCANQVVGRVLIVWLYNASGRSVFAATALHATLNVTTLSLFPVNGSHYDPLVADIVLLLITVMVVAVWHGVLSVRPTSTATELEPMGSAIA